MNIRKLFRALGAELPGNPAPGPEPKIIPLKEPARSLKIMLVDDCPDFLDIIEVCLRPHFKNARILKFADGEQAWQELVWREPDLLISDLMRPGVHGCELLRRLAQRRVKFPILIVSATLPGREREARQCAGAELRVEFMAKPFQVGEFVALVKQVLDAQPQPALAAAAACFSPARPLRVIHVDDESALLQMMAVLLQRRFKHLELLQFQNSVTAAHALARFNPDLLITDDRMPVLNGRDIVGQLAGRHAAFPIIVMSAWDKTETWVQAFADRGLRISYLSTPFNVPTFFDQVSLHLGQVS
jgi:DNA-binding NtrC family response regulator